METAGYLLLKRIHIENANAISSPITYGFPAITGFLGAVHALSRRLQSLESSKRGIHFAQVDVSFSPWTSRDLTPLAASTIRELCKSLMIGLQQRINVPTISCACVGHRGSPVLVVVRKRRG